MFYLEIWKDIHGCNLKSKATMTNRYGKPLVVIFPDGKRLMFDAIREACRVLRLDQANVSRCLSGKQKSYKGFTFEYREGVVQ